ncbi:MAG: alginate lyase family protein [Planctomycetota bacterium]
MLQHDGPTNADLIEEPAAGSINPARLASWRNRLVVKVSRGAAILRYHQARQLWTRLWNRLFGPIERRTWRPKLKSPPPVRLRKEHRSWRFSHRNNQVSRRELTQGRLRLLNRCAELGFPFDWQLAHWPDAPRLWRFQLHYHEFLADLLDADPSPASWALAWKIVGHWIESHPPTDSTRYRDAMHPYCISRRLPVWMQMFQEQEPPSDLRSTVLSSMTEQVEYLYGHPERDLGGNHWWENGRALTVAGCFFTGPRAERWRLRGMSWLDRCTAEQLSPSHEHFERSPMYQADLAMGLEQLAHWLMPVDAAASHRYRELSSGMLRFLDQLRHPDGNLPLFGDTTLDAGTGSVREADEKASHWVGEYYIHRDGGHQLNYDTGNLGPDHLPAHAHSDLLGFEMSLHGKRVLIDSGTYCYEGRKRSEYRSSRAHNVLVVDEMELADVWSSFRMGRRGHVVDRGSGATSEGRYVYAAHNAYRHQRVERILRVWFFADDAGPWFSAHLVFGAPGKLHRMTEYIHWHPSVNGELNDGTFVSRDQDSPITWELASDGIEGSVTTGSYSPDFHVEYLTNVFELTQKTTLPAISAWSIRPSSNPVKPWVFLAGKELVLSWGEGERKFARIPLQSLGIASDSLWTAKMEANGRFAGMANARPWEPHGHRNP